MTSQGIIVLSLCLPFWPRLRSFGVDVLLWCCQAALALTRVPGSSLTAIRFSCCLGFYIIVALGFCSAIFSDCSATHSLATFTLLTLCPTCLSRLSQLPTPLRGQCLVFWSYLDDHLFSPTRIYSSLLTEGGIKQKGLSQTFLFC